MNTDDAPKIKLEYYSGRFAKKLFKRFPQWKQYAGHFAIGAADDFANYLDMRIPSANPTVLEPLHIIMYPPQAVTITWIGGSHIHISDNPFLPCPDHVEQALEFLEAFVSDQIVFGCCIRDGKSLGGFVHHIAADFPSDWQRVENASTIIRSWLGGHDQTL